MKPRQTGSSGSSLQSLLVTAFLVGCVSSSAEVANFQYYRFTPTTLRNDAGSNSIQLSDFRFLFEGGAVNRAGVVVTNPGGNFPSAENPGNLVDAGAGTKWLDFYKSSVVFNFGAPTAIDGYGFSTGSDAPERDPLRWVFEGSADGVNWTLLDHRTENFAVPTDRNTATSNIFLSASPAAAVLDWTGGATGDWNTTASNWNGGANAWNNGQLLHARFSGAASTVTLTEGINARKIEFASAGHRIEGGTLTLGGITRIDAQTGVHGEIASAIAGSSGLVKTGGGSLTLSGINSYSGTTHVREGSLAFAGSGGTNTTGGNFIIGSVGNSGQVSLSDSYSLSSSGEIWIGNDNAPATSRLTISDNATVTKTGTSGFVTVGRANSIAELIVEDSGKLIAGNRIRLAEGSAANATAIFRDNAVVQGSENFEVGHQGTGTAYISGNASVTFAGGLTVGGSSGKGNLIMTGDSSLTANGNGQFVVGSGNGSQAVVTLSGNSSLNAENMKWKAGDFGGGTPTGKAEITLNDDSSLTLRRFTIGHIGGPEATQDVTVNDDAVLTVNEWITIGRDDATSNVATGSVGMNAHLTINGGTVATRSIRQGGIASGVAPSATHNNVIVNNGTIRALADEPDFFRTGVHETNGSSLSSVRPYVKIQAGGLVFDTNGHDVGILADLHGDAESAGGGLTKTGEGTLILEGSSTYTGDTIVTAGTLLVNGSLGTGLITVKSGANFTAGESASVNAAFHFEEGSNLSGNFLFGSESSLAFDLSSEDGDYTINLVGGTIAFDGFGIVNLASSLTSATNGTYILINDGEGASISFEGLDNFGEENAYLLGDGRLAWFESGSLAVVIIPEPSAALLGGLGMLMLGRRRR